MDRGQRMDEWRIKQWMRREKEGVIKQDRDVKAGRQKGE